MSTYTVETVLHGYHIYQVVWEAAVGQVLPYLLRSEAFIRSALGCRCLFSQATCFTPATILEEGTTVERGPSGFGSDEFVLKYLSKYIIGEMMP